MFYNQGNKVDVFSKAGALRRDAIIEADANHYWAEYITREDPYVFTMTIVFESYELYEEMNELILAGEHDKFLGDPSCIEQGYHGYVHNPTNMFVDWFVVN